MNSVTDNVLVIERSHANPACAHPRIGYDARFSLGEYRGMGRYLRRLIRGIEDQAIGFCATGESDPDLCLSSKGVRPYPLWEQISLPARVRESGVEFLLAPYNTAPLNLPGDVKLILVLHDFIYLKSSSELPLSRSAHQNFGRLYRRLIVPRAIEKAHRIICVSQHTQQELLHRFRVDEDKVSVIPNTIDATWFQLLRSASPDDYLFCVSGEAPNKNLEHALHGFAEYCRLCRNRSIRLVIAGVKPTHHANFARIADRLGIASRVQLLGYVPNEALQSLYVNARAFFFPSRHEGFGIPVLEALAVGVPVVASHASSIPEVAGDAALYFHPDSVVEIAEQLCTVLSNPHIQQTMSHCGRERSLSFHPSAVDALIANFWKSTLGTR